MFSMAEKQYIADEIEKLLLKLDHPEMPKEKPIFTLKVEGKESWSWAGIKPNWTFDKDNSPQMNLFNEVSRHLKDDIAKILEKEEN